MLMEHAQDISYGVIPLLKNQDQWKVFLIHQHGLANDVYWTFPKGHPEAGETQEEGALRELFEETGLVPEELKTDVVYTQEYTFLYEGTVIHKKVLYYIGIITDAHFVIQEEEVKEAGWFTFEEAQTRLSHDRAKTMLAAVASDIEDNL